MSSGSSGRKRFSGKSSRLVDSLVIDLSRAKTALTDAKIHERAIEVELMETRARERSIYQEAETLKSKLIGATRDQVEDVVEDVDELLRDWEFELGDPVEMEHEPTAERGDGEARGGERGRDGEEGEGWGKRRRS